jgi:hypothetical protein
MLLLPYAHYQTDRFDDNNIATSRHKPAVIQSDNKTMTISKQKARPQLQKLRTG